MGRCNSGVVEGWFEAVSMCFVARDVPDYWRLTSQRRTHFRFQNAGKNQPAPTRDPVKPCWQHRNETASVVPAFRTLCNFVTLIASVTEPTANASLLWSGKRPAESQDLSEKTRF